MIDVICLVIQLLHLQSFYSFIILGAGRFPTANSVLNDLIRISLCKSVVPFPLDDTSLELDNDYIASFYVRIKCEDSLGIIGAVGQAAQDAGVSIHSILQNPILNPKDVDFVVTTDEVKVSKVKDFASRISKMPFAKSLPLFMPILK